MGIFSRRPAEPSWVTPSDLRATQYCHLAFSLESLEGRAPTATSVAARREGTAAHSGWADEWRGEAPAAHPTGRWRVVLGVACIMAGVALWFLWRSHR